MTNVQPHTNPAFDRERLKSLVHYICDYVPNPNEWGSVKLNKALFYSDTRAYVELGEPITGETYLRYKMGPVSEHLREVVEELQKEGRIAVRRVGRSGMKGRYEQDLYFATREPDVAVFTAPQIKLVNDIVDVICKRYTADAISEASHDLVWEMAEPGEIIPYYTAYSFLLRKPSEESMAWARRSLGLDAR